MNKEQVGFIVIGVFIGAILAMAFVEMSPLWVTEQTCDDLTNLYYQQAVIDVANFTTLTGNFTYIYNNSIETRGVQDYCLGMIQNLNQGVQNG